MKFFDFNSDDEFNLNEEYSKVNTNSIVTPSESKITDAEKIIFDLGKKYVEGASLDSYEMLYSNLEIFLKKYQTDSDVVVNMTKEDRDKLFGYGITMFKNYEQIYQNLIFNFELSKEEWHFVDNALSKKMKYNGQEIFNYWQLKIDFLDMVENQFKQLPKEVPSIVVTTSVGNMILMSHLLMKHEENGSTRSFYHFKDILLEIAQMTKLFNAYGVMSERLSNKFNQWVNALNAIDGYNNEETRINEMSETTVVEEIENE